MKTISSAQADFRANDRDGNKINDFWRADVAGLYALIHPMEEGPDPQPIKMIELSIAAADATPVMDITPYANRGLKAGYRFKTLRFADETEPDPQRFAFAAYPDTLSAGRNMFVISHDNVVYRKHLAEVETIDVYPTPAELEADWQKLD